MVCIGNAIVVGTLGLEIFNRRRLSEANMVGMLLNTIIGQFTHNYLVHVELFARNSLSRMALIGFLH